MSIAIGTDGSYSFFPIASIESPLKPIKLCGDILAISDDISQTVIWNWKTRRSALLQHPNDDTSMWQVGRLLTSWPGDI